MSRKRYPFLCSAILFLIFSLVLYFFVPEEKSCFEIDSVGYDRVAHHFSLTNNFSDPYCPDQATVQTVGYHFFLGLFYNLFGHRFWPIVWFQIFLTVFSLLLLFLIARQLFDMRVASVSVFWGSVNIGFLVYPQFLLAESLLLSFVTGFDGCCRYRLLFEPILILLSSIALVFLYDGLRWKRFRKEFSC